MKYAFFALILTSCTDDLDIDKCFSGGPRDRNGTRLVSLTGLAMPSPGAGIIIRSDKCKDKRFDIEYSDRSDGFKILSASRGHENDDILGTAFKASAYVKIAKNGDRYTLKIIQLRSVTPLGYEESRSFIANHSIG